MVAMLLICLTYVSAFDSCRATELDHGALVKSGSADVASG